MDAKQRDELEALLLEQQARIQEAGAVKIDPNRQFADDPKVDDDAQPLNEMNQVIASSRNKARTGSLAQVEQALYKLRHYPDEFGLCEECELPIALGRLRVMPFAELCTRCQSAQESPRGGARRHLTDYKD